MGLLTETNKFDHGAGCKGDALGVVGNIFLVAYDRFEPAKWYLEQLEANSDASPFQDRRFVEALISSGTMFASPEPSAAMRHLFVVGFEKSRPVVIFPFEIRRGLLASRLSWIGDRICDYNGAIAAGGFWARAPRNLLPVLLGRIAAAYPEIDLAHLIRNPLNHPNLPGNMAGLENMIAAEYCAHAVALERDWKSFYARLRSKDTRRRFRNKLLALRKTGEVRFRRIRKAEERVDCANRIMDWKSRQLRGGGDRDPFGPHGGNSQLRQTVLNAVAGDDRRVDVFCLTRDGAPIAGVIGLVTRDAFHLWMTAYDGELRGNYSAGTILLIKLLELSARGGRKHFDFLIGDEPYKQEWCDLRIELGHYIRPLTAKGKLVCMAETLKLKAKKRLLQSPRAMEAIRTFRRAVVACGSSEVPASYGEARLLRPTLKGS